MGAKQVLGCGFMGLVFLGTLGLTVFVSRDKNRFRKYQRNFYWFGALLIVTFLLMEVLLPENSWLKLLIVPIFFFGGYYIFYDAYIKRQ